MIYVNNHVPTKYEIRLVPVISVLLLNFPETFQVQVDTVKKHNITLSKVIFDNPRADKSL